MSLVILFALKSSLLDIRMIASASLCSIFFVYLYLNWIYYRQNWVGSFCFTQRDNLFLTEICESIIFNMISGMVSFKSIYYLLFVFFLLLPFFVQLPSFSTHFWTEYLFSNSISSPCWIIRYIPSCFVILLIILRFLSTSLTYHFMSSDFISWYVSCR